MTDELKEAIRLIEEAGGFVMMQGNLEDEEVPLTEEQMDQLEQEEKEAFFNYQNRKRDAFKEFDKALGSSTFNYGTVEQICHENGIDMDDIEQHIHEMY